MSKLGISTGSIPNDGTGDSLIDGALKINSNFDEIYSVIGDGTNINLSGFVTSITAGDNIVVSSSTGNVTITGLANTSNVSADNVLVSGASTFSGSLSADNVLVSGASTFSSNVSLNSGLVVSGASSFSGDVSIASSMFFGDNIRAYFGSQGGGNDLQIYHDGSDGIIKDFGPGNLMIDSSFLEIRNGIGITRVATFSAGSGGFGAVQLYAEGVRRFGTTGYGVTVVGIMSATSFVGDGSAITGISTLNIVNYSGGEVNSTGLASVAYVDQQITAPIGRSLIPDTDNTYDLGSLTKQWRELYVTSNTMYVGGVPVGVSTDGRLTVNREPLAKLSELNEDRIEVLETDVSSLKLSSGSSVSSSAVLKTDEDFKLTDNKNASFQFVQGNDIYLRFNTFNNGEKVQILQDLWVSDGIHCADYIMLDGNNKELKFANSGGKYVGLKAPLGLSNNVVFTLPGLDGSNGQVLTTDGNGSFGWSTPSSGGSTTEIETEIETLKTKNTNFESLVGIASDRIEELQDAMITMQAVYNGQIQTLTNKLATLPKTVHASWDASKGSSFDWSTDGISSSGVSSVDRVKKGVYKISFSEDFSSTNYTITTGVGSNDYGGTGASPRGVSVLLESRTVSTVDVICERTDDAVNEDNDYMSVIIMGT